MSIETEYHGYTITYAENEDKWRCWELNIDAANLSGAKAKIAKILAATRKADAFPVYVIGSWGRIEKAQATGWASPDKMWIMQQRRRSQHSSKDLAPITSEANAAIQAARAIEKQIETLNQEKQAILAAIPRVTLPAGARFGADEEDAT